MQHLQSIRARYKALRLARQRLVKAFEAALWRRKGWEPGEILDARTGKREWIGTGPDRGKRRRQIIEPGTRKRRQPAQPAPSEQHREKTPVARKRTIKPKVDSQQKPATPAPDATTVYDATRQAWQELSSRALRIGGLVKIPDLYDAVADYVPGLSQSDFHALLQRWQSEDRLGLQLCDTPHLEPRASEGIATPRGLLHYVVLNDWSPLRRKFEKRRSILAGDEPAAWQATQEAVERLRQASRHLGGTVKIPDLADAVTRAVPGLTVEDFHRMLRQWHEEGRLLLKLCNDPRLEPRAREGIRSDRGLLHYVQLN